MSVGTSNCNFAQRRFASCQSAPYAGGRKGGREANKRRSSYSKHCLLPTEPVVVGVVDWRKIQALNWWRRDSGDKNGKNCHCPIANCCSLTVGRVRAQMNRQGSRKAPTTRARPIVARQRWPMAQARARARVSFACAPPAQWEGGDTGVCADADR